MSALLMLALSMSAGGDLRIAAGSDAAAPIVTARLPAALAESLPQGKVPSKSGEAVLRLTLLSPKGVAEGAAVFGSYERKGKVLTFAPRFALAAGERYRAILLIGGKERTVDYAVPARKPESAAEVSAVYPSADELPANCLKFYIHFSKPMREGPAIFDRVRLLDEKGVPLEDPWRRTELWNEDATRLTLWIHPGRIKEGVNLREDLGPVLHPSRKYTLVIEKSLPDAGGEPLAAAYKKSFRTTESVRTAIDVRLWMVNAPEPGTRQPLKVTFPRPLDRALLGRSFSLAAAEGKVIEGVAEVGAKELSWSFTPAKAWSAGEFKLTADERLEDLAGNTVLRPFDLDLKAPPMKALPRTLTIRIGS